MSIDTDTDVVETLKLTHDLDAALREHFEPSEQSTPFQSLSYHRTYARLLQNMFFASRAFDSYCRSFGATDLFSLFKSEVDGVLLADKALDAFPLPMWSYVIDAFNEINRDHRSAIAINLGAEKLGLRNETLWELVKLYFSGFIPMESKPDEMRVPIFCAHPAPLTGSKVKISYSSSSKTGLNFKLGLPGLSGGFGDERIIKHTISTGEQERSYQIQARVNYQRTTWRSDSQECITLSPLETVGLGSALKGDDRYIDYDSSRKNVPIQLPYDCSADENSKLEIKAGSKDKFEIKIALFEPLSGDFTIESEALDEFSIEHSMKAKNRYHWLGMDSHCHDILVVNEKY